MNTQVIVSFKFYIPKSEIADIDEKALVNFIKFNLEEQGNIPEGDQFYKYELGHFPVEVKEIWKNAKRLL